MTLDLSSLNEPQRRAVVHGRGPLLVYAGAGSGKTRVLTYRLAHLIESGRARPQQLLAVTFTNKAAGEMKRRVADLLGSAVDGAWVHTFHSACLRLLRMEAAHVGLDRGFVIYDERDQLALLKRVLKEVDPARRESPSAVRSAIERFKRQGLAPDAPADRRPPASRGAAWRAYGPYERGLRECNAVDFTDLLLLAVRLLRESGEVRRRYQERFRYLLVDEFQDTDPLQYELVRLLARPEDNLCVVGDDDQSIYSFRGADVSNIRGFARDYPTATVVRLEQNYRSTAAILDAASRVVNAGGGGEPKRLWTERGDGAPPTLEEARDEADEARRVARRVREHVLAGVAPGDIAVLFRTNAQSRSLEEAFERASIPFVLVGGTRFYERREIKDLLAYLRLLLQPADRVAFARAVRTPPRGIGDTTVGRVLGAAAAGGLDVDGAVERVIADGTVGKAVARRLQAFAELMRSMREEAWELEQPDLVAMVIERSGLASHHRGEGSLEGDQRAENLEELVRSTAERGLGPGLDGLRELLDRSALVADTDDLGEGVGAGAGQPRPEDAAGGRVSLMTVHCAKGLEFSVVCLIGLDEGLFPNSRAATFQSGLEEEHRLCYVACTRAEDSLHLFRARRRFLVADHGGYRGYRPTRPSPFLRHLVGAPPEERRVAPQWSAGWASGDEPETGGRREGPREDVVPGDTVVVYDDPPPDRIQPGTRVRHPTFGLGEVRAVDGRGASMRLTVFFRRAGMRRLVARWANLEILAD